jgi:hypothetical protein
MVPRERRDDFVDALMVEDRVSGFTLLPALGYSREHSHFSVKEQVVGYRQMDRFEVLTPTEVLPGLLDRLRGRCGREALRYWVTGLTREGHLRADE